MVITQSAAIATQLKSLRNYGAPRKYFHTERGVNSRLDTLQAAILDLKLPHLSHWNRQRYHVAKRYNRLLESLQPLGCVPLENQSGAGHVYHLYVVKLADHIDRQQLQDGLSQYDIQTGVHYPLPCHLQPAFRDLGYQLGDFPQAEHLCQTILSLPMYPGLQDAQVDRVAAVLESLLLQQASACSA